VDALPPLRDELLLVFLLLEDSDAQWVATLSAVLAKAEDDRAHGVLVHALGMSQTAAADLRLEQALERARNARAAAAANAKFAVAVLVAGSTLASGSTINQSLAQLTALTGKMPSADMEREIRLSAAVQRLNTATGALEGGDVDASAARAARAAALDLLPAGEAAAAAVADALALLDKACARAELRAEARQRAEAKRQAKAAAKAKAAAIEAAVGAAADGAAAAEAAAMPLASRLEALPQWEAALGAAASNDSVAAVALTRSLAHVRDAAALSARLAAAATPPPSADALPAALAALSAARAAAAAAPHAVHGALASELQAAALRCAQWAALIELAAATESADVARGAAAMKAATAAGADPDDIVRAMMPVKKPAAASEEAPAAPAAAPAAVAAAPPLAAASAPVASSKPTAPGKWLPAGPRLWFDVSTNLGKGSRGPVVHPGFYVSERGRDKEPCAVKRLRRDSGEDGKKQLEFVQREIENLTKLNACSPRVAFFLDHHAEQDFIYMAFEKCEESLLQRLQRAPALSPAQRIDTLAAVAAALRDCHAAGVAHNDVHAGNVLLKDGGATVKLTDVQLSVRIVDAITYSFSTFTDMNVAINMARRAPEMQNPAAKVTAAVDVWALGALAFQLLTDKESPFGPRGGRAKQGAGGGAGRASAPAGVALENLHIARGEHDLSPLDACGLPKHAAAEARHLLSACLAKDAFRRPTAAAVPAHPLFWDAAATAEALVTLRRRKPSEAALRRALSRADVPAAAYARLAAWRGAVHAPLLACAPARSRVTAYRDGLAELLRFARNALEHPPPPGALPPAHEP
jgi:serine/threonine protein kinase